MQKFEIINKKWIKKVESSVDTCVLEAIRIDSITSILCMDYSSKEYLKTYSINLDRGSSHMELTYSDVEKDIFKKDVAFFEKLLFF